MDHDDDDDDASCDCDRCAASTCWHDIVLSLRRDFVMDVFKLLSLLLSAFVNYLAPLTALAFAVMTIVWYALYRCGTTAHVYVEVLAVVLVVGWMFTLQFTKGFRKMHAFSVMLNYIVQRDITRFLIMYTFVLLGFGFAFHALFQLSPAIAGLLGSPFNTLFTAFNVMLGMGESPVDSSFDEMYEASGGDPAFVKWVYIIYVTISTIILLNLLIAMMTDTFEDIRVKEPATWQVGRLQLALRIERDLSFLHAFTCFELHVEDDNLEVATDDKLRKRYMMSFTEKVGVDGGSAAAMDDRSKEESVGELVKRLDNKLDRLQNAYANKFDDLSLQVDFLADAIQRRDSADRAEAGPHHLDKQVSTTQR